MVAPNGQPLVDYEIIRVEIDRARYYAGRPSQLVGGGRRRGIRRLWQEARASWTGFEVDEAWAALHRASQALLMVEDDAVVKGQLGDLAATVVTALDPGDIRAKGYMQTLEQLSPANVTVISHADREQLRAIRKVCDSSSDAAHGNARTFRNTLIEVGAVLAVVLVTVAIISSWDPGFRSIFAGGGAVPGPWYLFELELIASLGGLTSAVLALRSYAGYQFTFGLPFVQAWLKGGSGAATGLLGVLLVQSGIVTSLKAQTGGGVFAIAIIFGAAQYLFTRVVDQHANGVLASAGSRNDPATNPQVPVGVTPPNLTTTSAATNAPAATPAAGAPAPSASAPAATPAAGPPPLPPATTSATPDASDAAEG